MRRFGFAAASIEAARAALVGGPDNSAGVWPQNVTIVLAFLAASSQWRIAGLGGGFVPARVYFVGLDYAGARVAIEAVGIAITPTLWVGMQVMEAAARDALNGDRR